MFCNKCGNKMADDDKFCSSCGNSLNSGCDNSISVEAASIKTAEGTPEKSFHLSKAFKPLHKFVVPGFFVLITIIVLSTGFDTHKIKELVFDISPFKQSCKEIVKNGHFEKYPQKSIKEGFNGFFGTPKWDYFYSTDGKDVVEFIGECQYAEKTVTAKIQFTVNQATGTFELGSLSFNDVPENLLIEAALISKIFEETPLTEEPVTTNQTPDSSINPDSNDSYTPQDYTYKKYYNSRFGFEIEYPGFLNKAETSENDDGIILSNEAGDVKLTVTGSNNVLNSTAKSGYADAINMHNNISYKAQSDNWFILSWTEDNKIVYEKEVVGNGSINAFIFEYPIKQKDFYSPIVEILNASFMTSSLEESH